MIHLKNLVLIVCVFSCAYSLIMMLVPDKYRDHLKAVMSVIAVLAVGSYVLNTDISFDDISLSRPDFSNAGYSSSTMVTEELEKRLEESIEAMLVNAGVPVRKIEVSVNIDEDNCIIISKISLTVSGKRESYDGLIQGTVKEKIGDIDVETEYVKFENFAEDVNGY